MMENCKLIKQVKTYKIYLIIAKKLFIPFDHRNYYTHCVNAEEGVAKCINIS